ncbi:MAG: coproporphyrinogen III oxidase, partial [Lutibacter sp.]|nr:coproporphyrinogen III oxidase [Lutibacter sp.]
NIGLTSQVKNEIIARLGEIIGDGLIEVSDNKIVVKEEGRMFVRNICMAFDLRLVENQPEIRIFSMTI